MRKIIVLIFTLILSYSLTAQEENKSYYIEGSLGAAVSNIGTLSGSNGDLKGGLISSFKIGTNVRSNLMLETGVGYLPRGLKYLIISFNGSSKYGRLKQHFDFISIPARIGFQFGDKVKFYVKQSLNFDLMVQNTSEYILLNNKDRDLRSSDLFKRTNISTTSSFGINIPLDNYYFGFGTNANIGLLNIYKNPSDQNSENDPINIQETAKHITVDLSVHFGYRF